MVLEAQTNSPMVNSKPIWAISIAEVTSIQCLPIHIYKFLIQISFAKFLKRVDSYVPIYISPFIFSRSCVRLKAFTKIVRLLLAAVSIHGLVKFMIKFTVVGNKILIKRDLESNRMRSICATCTKLAVTMPWMLYK